MASHDVFISYSSADKAAADGVCHGLEARGVRCWMAPRDVIPGSDWQTALLDAISHAEDKTRLEDLYLPYRQKRRTKAQIAVEAGLAPLAEALLADPMLSPEAEAEKYLKPAFKTDGADNPAGRQRNRRVDVILPL